MSRLADDWDVIVTRRTCDATTLYFEAEDEDALRKIGYSKERRVDPQIVVGLLVDLPGFPWRSAVSRATRPRPRP